jgi:predicted pyridoxine 5'-phosphate oxidase superfamily flavin-nucleotide-binding protein
MLTKDIVECAKRSVLCWLATCDAEGMPNVSPKEIFTIWSDTQILIANIASPGSVRNIEVNAQVCLCFVDVLIQKGFKLKGQARNVRPSDPDYLELVKPLEAMTFGRFVIESIILMEVVSVDRVLAPSYQFYGHEVSEMTQKASAMKAYGVQPL